MLATEKITLVGSQKKIAEVEMVSRAEETERRSNEGLRMVREVAKVVGNRGESEKPKATLGAESVLEAME